jgi:PAS domain S-box-containing protein
MPPIADSLILEFVEGYEDAIVRVDGALQVVYANRAARRLFDIVDESDHADVRLPAPLRVALGGSLAERTRRTMCISCGDRTFEWRLIPASDPSSGTRSVAGIGRDVTEVIAATHYLIHTVEAYRALVETEAAFMWRANASGQMQERADIDGILGTPGPSERAVPAGSWLAQVHEEERARVVAAWERARDTGRAFEDTHRLKRHDGASRTMRIRGVPVHNADGSIREWIGAANDITDRLSELAALRESEARHRQIIESLPVGLAYLEGERLTANPMLQHLTGCAGAKLRTLDDWFGIVFGDAGREMAHTFREDRAAGFPVRRTVSMGRPGDIVRSFELTGTTTSGFDLCVVQEVTGRELMLAELRARLAETRGCHEGSPSAACRSERQSVVIPSPHDGEVLDLNAVVASLIEPIQETLPSTVSLEIALARSACIVRSSREEIERIVMNLVEKVRSAAIEIPGAVIVLSTEEAPLDRDGSVTESTSERPVVDGHVSLTVHHSGGATASVLLPSASSERVQPPAPTLESYRGHETVLLVDDNAAVRAIMRRILARHG